MAGSAIVETVQTLSSSKTSEVKKKVTLHCTTDDTAGTIAVPLTVGLVEHLKGFYLYKVTAYPGLVPVTTDNSPLTIVASTWSLPYDTGSVAFVVGELVTGASSGATGIVQEVLLSSGTWAGGDAAGSLLLRKRNNIGFTDDEVLGGTNTTYLKSYTAGVAAANDGTGVVGVANKSIDILGGNGVTLIDSTTTKECVPELAHPSLNFYPVMDSDNTYTVTVTPTAGNSKNFILELMFVQ